MNLSISMYLLYINGIFHYATLPEKHIYFAERDTSQCFLQRSPSVNQRVMQCLAGRDIFRIPRSLRNSCLGFENLC